MMLANPNPSVDALASAQTPTSMYPICASASVLDQSIVSQVSATNPSVIVDDSTPAAHAASIISILSQEDNGVAVHRSQSVMDDGTMPEIPSLSTYDDDFDALPRLTSSTLVEVGRYIDIVNDHESPNLEEAVKSKLVVVSDDDDARELDEELILLDSGLLHIQKKYEKLRSIKWLRIGCSGA
jgi:hypothetical protein